MGADILAHCIAWPSTTSVLTMQFNRYLQNEWFQPVIFWDKTWIRYRCIFWQPIISIALSQQAMLLRWNNFSVKYIDPSSVSQKCIQFTYWLLKMMITILERKSSNALSWLEMLMIYAKFYWNLFQMVLVQSQPSLVPKKAGRPSGKICMCCTGNNETRTMSLHAQDKWNGARGMWWREGAHT